MMKFSPVSLLFLSLVALVLVCSPKPAFGQRRGLGSHGGSSHGGSHGGGSHGGGHGHASGSKFHGGASSHGGGFHGSSRGSGSRGQGRPHASRGRRSSRSSDGFHRASSQGNDGRHFAGRSSHGGAPVGPSQAGGGSHGTSFAPNHSARPSSLKGSGAQGHTSGDGQWHSFSNRGNFAVTGARGPSSFVGDGQWHSFENLGNTSVTAGRGSTSTWQGGAAKWNGQGHQTSPNSFGSHTFAHSEAPSRASNTVATASNRRFAEPPRRTTGSTISASRAVSNIDHSRFGNSATNRFSFSNSRFGSHVRRFERPEFGDQQEFRGGESRFGFGRESSYGGDAFSFFPDLLGLALAFGSFGARGFGLPGLALNLLESGFGDFGNGGGYDGSYGGNGSYDGPANYDTYGGCTWTPGPVSPYWAHGVIPYPADNLTCPQ